jgi:TonB-linked SusC/RagA family outer membrane protein
MQQQITVTGIVIDESGESLPGAAVRVKGSTRGVTADLDGSYSINVQATDVLEISFIGYETTVVAVENRRKIDVVLKAKTSELEEVTVVAFAKQKKESVIASVTTINPAELKVPSSNLTTAFAGRIAGLISYQRTGEPGQDNAQFFIRGVTNFGTGKKDPLILIDGVEMTTEDLSRLTTDDIASFSIMKDANATALYGARGANGVILVNTKEGREGTTKIQLRLEGSISQPTENVGLVDPVNYMKYHNEAVITRTPGRTLPYDQRKIAYTERGIDPVRYPAVDWQDLLFDKQTFNQRYNLNVSGGGTIARYYIAAAYAKDQGIIKNDPRNGYSNNIDIRKYSLRSNVNVNLTKTTEVIVRLSGAFDDYQGPLDGGTDLYNKAINSNPVYPKMSIRDLPIRLSSLFSNGHH